MNIKFIKKYMRLAKMIGEDQNPCPSRQIGTVIVDPNQNRILGTGYNGPPKRTPHTTDYRYLREFLWPQLTDNEKDSIRLLFPIKFLESKEIHVDNQHISETGFINNDVVLANVFSTFFHNSNFCPRRFLKIKSGERLTLCSCAHSEVNAIINAAQSVLDAYMFCWCSVPCLSCTAYIINSQIARIYCLDEKNYHDQSEWLLKEAKIVVVKYNRNDF